MSRLDDIRARMEAATDGPWYAAEEIDGVRAGRKTVVKRHKDPRDPFRAARIVTVDQTRRHVDSWKGQEWPVEARAEDNVEFIAHARQDVEDLVGTLELVREQADLLFQSSQNTRLPYEARAAYAWSAKVIRAAVNLGLNDYEEEDD